MNLNLDCTIVANHEDAHVDCERINRNAGAGRTSTPYRRHRQWLVGGLILLALLGKARCSDGASITYSIDSARTAVTGSGNFRNIPLSPQTANSLVDQLQGALRASWQDTGLTFTGGSTLTAMPHPEGPFEPAAAATGSGAMVDNFGAEGQALFVLVLEAAVRDAVADIASGTAQFGGPVSDLQFRFSKGTVDYRDHFNDEYGFIDLTTLDAVPNTSTGILSRTVENGLDTIRLPIVADVVFDVLEPADSRLVLQGDLVATAPVLTIETDSITSIGAAQHLSGLQLEPNSSLRLVGQPLVTRSLQFPEGRESVATIDLAAATTGMIIDYPATGSSPATEVRERILSARGRIDLIGAWNGPGITSELALTDTGNFSVGWADNRELPLGQYASFQGEPVDETSILIRATRLGDATLDGVVNDDDVTIVSATYGVSEGAVWAFGDFTYDGKVDDDDVTLVSALYEPNPPAMANAPSADGTGATVAVPEPSTWLLALAVFISGSIVHCRSLIFGSAARR
jgi:hypothetical protein